MAFYAVNHGSESVSLASVDVDEQDDFAIEMDQHTACRQASCRA